MTLWIFLSILITAFLLINFGWLLAGWVSGPVGGFCFDVWGLWKWGKTREN